MSRLITMSILLCPLYHSGQFFFYPFTLSYNFYVFYIFLYILVETELVKISVKTYYFSVETFCKNQTSVRKAETFKRAKYVQSIKIE